MLALALAASQAWGPGPTIAPLEAFDEAQAGRDPLSIDARDDFFVTKKHILDALEVQAPFLVGADRQHFWTNLSLVDVGAGGAEITSYLTHKYGLSSRALDILPPEQNRFSLRKNEGNAAQQPMVPVEVFDGSHLPCADNSADMVLFNSVLHHAADDTEALLQEAARVSRRWIVVLDDLYIPSNKNVVARHHAHDPHGKFRRLDEWYNVLRSTRGVVDVRHDMLCMHMDDTQEPCFSFNTSHRRFYALFVVEVTSSVSPYVVSARQEADPKAERATRRTDGEGHSYHVPPHKEASTREHKSKQELAASGAELFSKAWGELFPNSTAVQPNLTTGNATTFAGTGGPAAALVAKAWAEARAEEHLEEDQVGLLQEQPRNHKVAGGARRAAATKPPRRGHETTYVQAPSGAKNAL